MIKHLFHKVHIPFHVNQLKLVSEVAIRKFPEIKVKDKMRLLYIYYLFHNATVGVNQSLMVPGMAI